MQMLLNLEVFLVISFSSFVPLSPLANTSLLFPLFSPVLFWAFCFLLE